MFANYNIPIYYLDGRVGYADQWTIDLITSGAVDFGAYPKGFDMARGRKPAKSAVAEKLSAALDFVKPATRDVGQYSNHDHILIANKRVKAFNGRITMSTPIDEDIEACPHYDRFRDALNKCGKTLTISTTEGGKLSIKGDKLNALIPCIDEDDFADINADFGIAQFDMTPIIEAIKLVGILAEDDAETVLESSVLLQPSSCFATDRHTALEAYHGINMPIIALPKAFVSAVSKIDKKPINFGYSDKTFTIHFEDTSWIKTTIFEGGWPDVSQLFAPQSFPAPVPPGLLEAIGMVKGFSDSHTVKFMNGAVWSHASDKEGAQYPVEGLQETPNFWNGDYWGRFEHLIEAVDITTYPDKAFFFKGTTVRGLIAGKAGE